MKGKNNKKPQDKYPHIRLGLCCIAIRLKYKYRTGVLASRTVRQSTILEHGLDKAKDVAIGNVVDLGRIITWSKNHGIDVVRMTSDIVPHATNKDIVEHFGKEGEEYASLEFLRPYLKTVGYIAKKEGMRLTFHPGQYVQIGSPTYDVFLNSVKDLNMHATILDMLDTSLDSVMVLHMGGTYCNKVESVARFRKRFSVLPEKIRRRIVLENDERCYGADDVLETCEELGVPMVLDVFHHVCYDKNHPDSKQTPMEVMMPRVLKTWGERRPKFHLSEQYPGGRVGSHSVLVETIPQVLLKVPEKYGVDIDIMIEAKGKEVAVGKLYNKYPKLKPKYRRDLPRTIPKAAQKDMKIPDELADCKCY